MKQKKWNKPDKSKKSSYGSALFKYECSLEQRRQWQPTPVLLPGKSHGRRGLVGCSPWGREESDTTGRLHFHFSLPCIGEGNSNPQQCSCLENPRDGGAWWAAIDGVTQSWTRLKRLSSSSSSSLEMHLELWRRKSKPGQWYFSEKIQDYSDIFLNLKNKNKKWLQIF